LNEPSTSNELNAALPLMNDIEKLESLMLWRQHKNIILNRQQYRLLEDIINIRYVTHPAYDKQLQIFFKIKKDLDKVRGDIMNLYYRINPSYSKKDYLDYIITLSHIIENTYEIPLNFYQYNIEEGETPYNIFMRRLYHDYTNKDLNFPFIKAEHNHKSMKQRIMLMIENMEQMRNHYKVDIDAIDNDNMLLLFKTIQNHLSKKQDLVQRFKERKKQNALKEVEVQPINNRNSRKSLKLGPIALRKLQNRTLRLSNENKHKSTSPRASPSPPREISPKRQVTPEHEKLLQAIQPQRPLSPPRKTLRQPMPRRSRTPSRRVPTQSSINNVVATPTPKPTPKPKPKPRPLSKLLFKKL
jgi:hypothetical protein